MNSQLQSVLGPALYDAIKSGDLPTVRALVPARPSAPILSPMLTVAASSDRADIVSYALSLGAAVTDPVLSSIVASHASASHRVLVEQGAVDINRFVPWHGDVLSIAALAGDEAWTRFCLEHGADPNLNMVEGWKSLLATVAEEGAVQMLGILVEGGARLEDSGALILAAEAGEVGAVRFLLEKGARVDEIGVENLEDELGNEEMGTALHKAVAAGKTEVVEVLIEGGANQEVRDVKGRTPLDLARAAGQEECVKLLEARQVAC